MIFPTKNIISVGVDEAGRGPLAFDVYAAAVIMPSDYDDHDVYIHMIKDSKKISAKKRDNIAQYIKEKAVAYGIGIATVEEIDKYNILQATYMAMHRALEMIEQKIEFEKILVDGDKFKPYISKVKQSWIPFECVVDGDNTYLNIAAASILAKTERDHKIDEICKTEIDLCDKYGFEKNKGYGTAQHMKALETHGACKYHRTSFAPVKKALRHQ